VDNEVTLFMKNNDISAVTVGVIENGKIQFEKSYGTYSRENIKPVTTDSLFQIGSQTKVITSLITLAAVHTYVLKSLSC
jgi:CubicO group peptidase (beta-lactamase class C family)